MPSLFDRVLMLKQTSVFSAVNTDDLQVVAREMKEEAFFRGDLVFRIGEPSDTLYIIERGSVGISLCQDPKIQEFIATLGPMECFGEMGIFDNHPRSATTHVLEDSVFLSIGKGKLRSLIVSYPELALGMLRSLSQRLRETNQRIS